MPDRAASRVLDAWTDRLAPVAEAAARAGWAAACDASDENRAKAEEAALAADRARHDPRGFERLEQSLAEGVADPLLRRALEALRRELLPWRVARPERLVVLEADLQAHFARYRAEVDGRRLTAHEVTGTLRSETDEGRLERTWRAAMGVGTGAAERVREAVRLRNDHARALGYPDHRALRLEAAETDPAFLARFLDDLESGTEAPWRALKARLDEDLRARFGRGDAPLAPWHKGDVFLQGLPKAGAADPFEAKNPVAVAWATHEGAGLDVGAVLAASDLHPREGKNPHAFCTHLDRKGDVRVLANVVPSARWTRTMLHELGHAVYDRNLDVELPWNLVRPPHSCVTEGVAMLFDRLLFDPAWREEVAGLDPDPAEAARVRDDLLTFVRWGLVVSRFEERLYADPEQDLDALWWDLVERLQGIPRPDPVPSGGWAAKIHVACYPVYYHAYLLGQAVASLLGRWIREDLPGGGLVGNPEAGRALVERLFRGGALLPWDRLVRHATGREVTAAALLADLLPASGSPASAS